MLDDSWPQPSAPAPSAGGHGSDFLSATSCLQSARNPIFLPPLGTCTLPQELGGSAALAAGYTALAPPTPGEFWVEGLEPDRHRLHVRMDTWDLSCCTLELVVSGGRSSLNP